MLSTIGYEGAKLDDFVGTLVSARIRILVDVRERAQSRRKGFSKTALKNRLAEAGIDYVHYRQLGDPKEGRNAARSGNMKLFRSIYRGVLATSAAKCAIREITQLQSQSAACLMCYEREYTDCHRKLVSDKIARQTGRATKHLKVFSIEQASKRPGRMRGAGEGNATPQQQLL